MKNYEVGKVYIWQNQVGGLAYLKGKETIVTHPGYMVIDTRTMKLVKMWETDTPCDCGNPDPHCLGALLGDLRPKDAPSGEKSVLEMFKKKPELELT